MKKRITAVFLMVVLAAALLSGCKQNVGSPEDNAVVDGQDNTEDDAEATEHVLGFSCSDLSNPFYTVLREAVQSSLEEERCIPGLLPQIWRERRIPAPHHCQVSVLR